MDESSMTQWEKYIFRPLCGSITSRIISGYIPPPGANRIMSSATIVVVSLKISQVSICKLSRAIYSATYLMTPALSSILPYMILPETWTRCPLLTVANTESLRFWAKTATLCQSVLVIISSVVLFLNL